MPASSEAWAHSGRLLRGRTEHHAAGQDGRLAAVVVGDLVLSGVDEDARLASTLPARKLELGLLVGGGLGDGR